MKAYAIQLRKGTYLTDTMGETNSLQECMLLKDKATAELYLNYKEIYSKVVEINIREEQGQLVAYKE